MKILFNIIIEKLSIIYRIYSSNHIINKEYISENILFIKSYSKRIINLNFSFINFHADRVYKSVINKKLVDALKF